MHARSTQRQTKPTHILCVPWRQGWGLKWALLAIRWAAVQCCGWKRSIRRPALCASVCFLNLWEQHLCVFKANLCELESFTEARAEKIYLRVALQLHVVVLVIVHACGEWLYLVFTSMSLPAVTEQKLDSSSSPPPVLQYEGDMKVDDWTANQ